jgi:DNA-binding response OmpR family regulator
MRILLVYGTPEPQLTRELARDGHDVLAIAAQERTTRLLDVFRPHVVLVATTDVTVTCQALRHHAAELAIVAIAPDRNLDHRIAALQAGADDCVSTPFHPAELSARMRAAVRRGTARSRLADKHVLDGAA